MGKVGRLQAEADKLGLDQAAQASVDSAQLSPASLRIYRASLKALCAGLGPSASLSELQPQVLAAWFADRYFKAAPATWNRELAILRSAGGAGRAGWPVTRRLGFSDVVSIPTEQERSLGAR